jgi:hypothetical protein
MNSTWLLIKTQRRGLVVGMSICFLVLFFTSFYDEENVFRRAVTIHAISLIATLIAGCFAGFHTALFKLPTPVSYRQLGWVPTFCLGALWLSCFAGTFVGIVVLTRFYTPRGDLQQWTSFFVSMFKLVPLSFAAFAVFDRLIRYMGSRAAVFGFFAFLFFQMSRHPDFEPFLVGLQLAWPICLPLAVFFIYEAPIHIRSMDHPDRAQVGAFTGYTRMPGSPYRTPAVKIWADTLMAFMPVPFVIWIVRSLGPIMDVFMTGFVLNLNIAIFSISILIILREIWRNAQAGGFGKEKTALIIAMKCSMVFAPVAWAFGAKRGFVASCDQCQLNKFVWATRCPHCGHMNQGTLLRQAPTMPWKRKKEKSYEPFQVSSRYFSRMTYRFLIPFQMGIFSMLSQGEFQAEYFAFTVEAKNLEASESDSSGQAKRVEMVEEVKAYFDNIENTREWLNGNDPIPLPHRYRIEVLESNRESGDIGFLVYLVWLKWDRTEGMGDRIQTRMVDELPDFPMTSLTVSEPDRKSIFTNRFTLSSTLDEGVHWRILGESPRY